MNLLNRKFHNRKASDAGRGQERLLALLYGTAAGRILLKPLVHPAVSKLGGMVLSSGWSRILIPPFVKHYKIDLSQFQRQNYRSYNEFFSRKIRPGARPVDTNPSHFISPCDSKLTVLPITPDCRFTVKHTSYTVASLLQNKALAESYSGGQVLIFRLTVDDYHRYCYPVDGEKSENIRIPGVFHTVNPIANERYPIYRQNTREYTLLHSPEFGDIVMMEIGALLVGKIVNHHGRADVKRGQEKGYFQFGGSTIVLLVKNGVLKVDDEIMEKSRLGLEGRVKYGGRIGKKN